MIRPSAALTVLLALASSALAEPLRILSWNAESGGSNPAKITEQLGQFRDYHIVGLTEVGRQDFARYTAAVAGEYRGSRRYIGGLTGGGDRLLIIYDTHRLELTMQRYRRRYPTAEKMGKLRFSDVEVQPLGQMAALMLGRWHLIRDGDDLEGNFSLVVRQVDSRWLIVHDHTSLLRGEE